MGKPHCLGQSGELIGMLYREAYQLLSAGGEKMDLHLTSVRMTGLTFHPRPGSRS